MPSSVRSNQRAAMRRAEVAHQSLGLEEELSFGSDEDLMETIGEINVPAPPTDKNLAGLKNTHLNASTNSLKRPGKVSKASTLSLRSHKNRASEASLASSTHLLPPLPPVPAGSTLDLPSEMFGEGEGDTGSTGSRKQKRGSLMGTFKSVKGLRKWRDDHSSRSSFASNDSQSPQTSMLSLSKMGSNTSSRPSLASSYAQSPVTPAYSAPQLAHLNLSHGSHLSFEQPPKGYPSSSSSHDIYGKQQPRYEPSLGNSSVTTDSSAPVETPPVTATKARATSSWYRSELSSAILPEFPATSSQLQPITVLAVPASFRQVTAGFNGTRQSRWVPCTLIFTCFKMSVDDKPHGSANEHSVAHIHVLSAPSSQHRGVPNNGSIGSLRRPSKSNGPSLVADNTARREIERRLLTRYSSAEITRDYAHSEGRDLALRIMFGDCPDGSKASGEWQLEIKDMSQLKESVNQVKKTAIMINAEELGYGHAIRDAFGTPAVSADELAQKLSIHARAAAARRDRKISEAGEPPTEALSKMKLQMSPKSSASQEMGRRDSFGVSQSAAMSRSRSAEEVRLPASPPAPPPLPVIEDTLDMPEPREDVSRLSFGSTSAFTLASAMAFPAPPSDLPPRRTARPLPAPPHPAVNVVAPGGEYDADGSGAATPLGPRARSGSMSSSKRTLTVHDRSTGTPSVNSNTSGSSTSRLRRLRGKPQVVDIMAEFSAIEAESAPPPPPEEDEEPLREDRARRIRFAGE